MRYEPLCHSVNIRFELHVRNVNKRYVATVQIGYEHNIITLIAFTYICVICNM